jgi:hypothetical protein
MSQISVHKDQIVMFNEFIHLNFISIVAANPTLPLALALAPAVALLDVAIYRRKQEAKNRSLDQKDRYVNRGGNYRRKEKEGRKQSRGRQERETHRRLHPALLLASGWRLVDGDGERRRSCGRRLRECVRLRACCAWGLVDPWTGP